MTRSTLFFVFKLSLTLGLLGLLLTWVDLASVWERIRGVNPVWLFAALSCVVFAYILSGNRWAWILEGLGISVSRKRKVWLSGQTRD